MSSWAREFGPSFVMPQAILAGLSAGTLEDISWHNDACPSVIVTGTVDANGETTVVLWIDWENPEERDNGPDFPRFFVTDHTTDVTLYEGDDEVAAYLALIIGSQPYMRKGN